MEGNEAIIRHGWSAYSKALFSLQKAIYDPVEAVKSETLCATMILTIYEVCHDSMLNSSGWRANTSIVAVCMHESRLLDEAR